MGNAILDVVLGLILIYAVLALLVTTVQEHLDGNILRGRVATLHDLVHEAVGQDVGLKEKVLTNPLIYALYRGTSAKAKSLHNSGPTAIPPDLFARALLIELNGGKPPSEEFAGPSAFLSAKAPVTDPPRIWKVLSGLQSGREGNWPTFETAIAEWFTSIGDRSEGWFKRRAQRWSFVIALVLAGLLNVDSLHIAKTLSQDSEIREALADIAERANAQRNEDAGTPRPTTIAVTTGLPPEDVAAARLTEAIHSLTDATAQDKLGGFATFDGKNFPGNTIGIEGEPACKFALKTTKPGSDAKPPLTTKEWLYALPAVRAGIEEARTKDSSTDARNVFVNAHVCLAHLSSWLAVAETFSSNDIVRRSVRDATVAIEGAKTALLTLVKQRSTSLSLRRSYQTDPEAVRDCRELATTPAEFSACVEQALRIRVRLPILPLQTTMSLQFCEVKAAPDDQFPPRTWICGAEPLAKKDAIGIRETLYLSVRNNIHMPWVLGVLITALFAALGAPFWFDLLGKVVKLRAAGRVRDETAAEARAGGKTPPPAVPGGGPSIAPTGPAAGPFAQSRNAFEDNLVVRDIVALQQALTSQAPNLQATGQLDQPTRSAIAAWCVAHGEQPATEELSRELYHRIVGRDATRTPAAPISPRMRLNQISSQVQPVARRLMEVLEFPNRIAAAETRFTADLRALAVLYRYKRDKKTPDIDRDVFAIAKTNPASLDELDESLIDEILKRPAGSPLRRDLKPWLDWAIGELGQVEIGAKNRANSNQRICEYLDTADKTGKTGDAGDDTAWCGAFVAWVLERHLGTVPTHAPAGTPPPPVARPLLASNWSNWATQRALGSGAPALNGVQRGDVVLFKASAGSSGHVAFFIHHDPTAQKVWVLGGNQTKQGCVSLTAFPDQDVVTVRGV